MIDSLKPLNLAHTPCKICGAPAELYGVVDFHKSCEELKGIRLALSGIPIYYRRCVACKFVFTDAFDDWSTDQFKTHVYNAGYKIVDPGFESERPRMNAKVVLDMWAQHKSGLRVLDFGGGNDALCTALRDNGFAEALTYDPMMPQYAQRPEGKFDLVTSFETIEHLPDPMAGVASIVESAAVPGLVFFTTTIQPLDFDTVGLNWWYVAPRNGHVSIFSRQALTAAWARHGYKVVSVDSNTHIAFHTLPSYCNIGALAGDQVKE